ncbi:uncharacterized protein LOC6550609 [Drosophila erecta]|uniref:Uncharacterized protein n=1 Tax=Drosophila erecta TaxID=7220 RepID=B3NUW5_DROER|nr:uncharacterized protein LOC6550609 [Drosophila erecta]EDV47063.1 uncharacterized protein Dere_GG19426 [Drosophila erecta]
MYTMRRINDVFCQLMRTYLDITLSCCESYSIWKFPTNFDRNIELAGTFVCSSEEMFPFMFYYALGISVVGSLHNFLEFINISFERFGIHLVRMWRPRNATNFRDKQLRRFRIVGSILMFKAWSLLLYALVSIKPHYIAPWVIISATTISIDLFLVLLDVLLYQTIEQRSLLILSFPLINLCCVLSVQSTLKRLIETCGTQDLVWWT